jgi:hypothetical protein
MNSRLEQFIRDHREEFDGDEPGKNVWDAIQKQTAPGNKQKRGIITLSRTWWSAVAASILVLAGGAWYFSGSRTLQPVVTAGHTTAQQSAPIDTGSKTPALAARTPIDSSLNPTPGESVAGVTPKENKDGNNPEPTSDALVNEEMYHYARLVELKHKELKTIEKDEPLLYRQFASDVSKLDSVYLSLQKQLPDNPNREQLLEAMLQNLQLQMGLLNHQLDIIKQINHSKKTAYDKAYKTA